MIDFWLLCTASIKYLQKENQSCVSQSPDEVRESSECEAAASECVELDEEEGPDLNSGAREGGAKC